MEQTISNILKKLTLPYAATLFFVIAFLMYGNALFNQFVWDDKVLYELQPHVVNLAVSFEPNGFNKAGQYHPLQHFYFSILYVLFGAQPFMYHVLQILLHVTCVTLLYILFRKFLSSGIALFSALVFLIHPIQVESVSYIAQTASPLFFLLGIIPLLICMREDISNKTLVVAFILLLLSLFEKETGVLFLVLMFAYSLLYARKHLLKLSTGAFITLGIYTCIRLFVGHVAFETRPLIPIASLSLPQRLGNVPMIMFYYLKTLFFPRVLAYNQQWTVTTLTFSAFYLPLLLDISFLIGIYLAGRYIFKRHQHDLKPFLLFSAWFLCGLFFILQIFPIDNTVADRWFYFPLAGLLGLVGLLLQYLNKKLSIYGVVPLTFLLSLLVILAFAARTIVRNSDWQNGMTLNSHDIKYEDNFLIEEQLGIEYLRAGEKDKGIQHLQKSVAMRPYESNLNNLGLAYGITGNMKLAGKYFAAALHTKDYKLFLFHKHDIDTYMSYAGFLVFYDNASSAIPFIQNALTDYPDSPDLWVLLALAQYRQHDKQASLDAAGRAYQLNPSEQNMYIDHQLQSNEPVSQDYNGKTFTFNPE